MNELGDPHVLGPGLLPTPFTADEIREATGRGKTIEIRVENGGTASVRFNRFRETDAEGATLDRWTGEAPEEVSSNRVTWAELQAHAAFDAETTSLSTETLSLPAPLGEVSCLRYDTEDGVFWFSLAHAGMPVRYESEGVRTTVVRIVRD